MFSGSEAPDLNVVEHNPTLLEVALIPACRSNHALISFFMTE
jgi:hypothetical protein